MTQQPPQTPVVHLTTKIAFDSKLGIDATKKILGEGFNRPWPPLIRMDENSRKKMDALFGNSRSG